MAFLGAIGFPGDYIERIAKSAELPENLGWRKPRWHRSHMATIFHQSLPIWQEDRHDRQPLNGGEGRFVLAGNFALQQRDDLARALDIAETIRPTLSDADFVLRAWEKWGPRAAWQLKGQFQFAVWDHETRKLSLVCDEWSNGTIYYYRTDDGIIFSSLLRWMLACPAVPRDLDPRWMAGVLTDTTPAGVTPYRHLPRVHAGTMLTIPLDGTIQTDTLWSGADLSPIRYRRDQDYYDAATELLEKTVREYQRARDPLTVTLSSGLDSSAILATLARQAPARTITALSIAPPTDEPGVVGFEIDETKQAVETARRFSNVRHVIRHREGDDPLSLDDSRAYFLRTGAVNRAPLNLSFMEALYKGTHEQNSNMLVTGVGGDLTLSYAAYPAISGGILSWRPDKGLINAIGFRRWCASWNEYITRIRAKVLSPLIPEKIKPLYRAKVRGIHHPIIFQWSLLNKNLAAEIDLETQMRWNGGNIGETHGGRNTISQRLAMHKNFSNALPVDAEYALQKWGVTLMNPLMNRDLFSFCLRIPDDMFIRRGQTRFLARRVLESRLPPEVINGTNRTMQTGNYPARLWGRKDELVGEIDKIARSSLAETTLDIPRLRKLMAQWHPDERAADFNKDRWLNMVSRAVALGQFIRWTENSND